VFIRADLNVPQDDAGQITEDTRIRASGAGIRMALDAGAAVMVTSHLGRPTEGEFKPEDSLAPVAARLGELLGRAVPLVADWVDGVDVQPGQVVLLENCRVNKGEKKNNEALARRWPRCATSSCTTPSAPRTAPRPAPTALRSSRRWPAPARCWRPRSTPSRKALANPKRPLLAIVAGSKVSTKLTILQSLASEGRRPDRRRRHRQHLHAGRRPEDRQEPGRARPAGRGRAVIAAMKARGAAVPIPTDVVVRQGLCRRRAGHREGRHRGGRRRPDPRHRPADRAAAGRQLQAAGTIVWNGPVGVFEFDAFCPRHRDHCPRDRRRAAFSIAGGGDTLAAIAKYGIEEDVGYISTGGGAFLEVLEGKTLPAFEILQRRAAGAC
jgi:phosphoglycerate kinase